MSLDLESTEGRAELEWPQEVVGLLEAGSAGHDLVDQVLHAVDTVVAELASNDAVVRERDSRVVDFTVSSLVDELGNSGSRWVAVGDEWLNHLDHVPGGLVQSDKDGVVELSESQELEDLLGLGGKLTDTI